MPESGRKFLIIRLSSIGDIVHALPAVSALGRSVPHASIHWIVEARHSRLLEGNPYVQRVITIDSQAWRRNLASRATLAAIRREVRHLREEHYDAAIDFQGLYKSALIGQLSGARARIGFAESRLREPGAGFLYSQRISGRGVDHVIDLNFALLGPIGVPRPEREHWEFPLPSSGEDEEFVARALDAQGTKDFIILNPGGGWQSKCWAPEDYTELIRTCSREWDFDFLLTGSPDEASLIQRIIEQAGVRRARYFPSTVNQFILLARRARLLVAGDTGPLHLATAVRTPVVALFGPTDPARNGPFSPADIALWNRGTIDYTRRAVNAGYLSGISVETVAAAIRRRLESKHE